MYADDLAERLSHRTWSVDTGASTKYIHLSCWADSKIDISEFLMLKTLPVLIYHQHGHSGEVFHVLCQKICTGWEKLAPAGCQFLQLCPGEDFPKLWSISVLLGDNWNCVFLSLRTYQGDKLAGLHDGGQVLAWEDKSQQPYIHCGYTREREGHVTTCTCGVSRGPGSMFTQIHPLKFIQNILNIVAVRFFKS